MKDNGQWKLSVPRMIEKWARDELGERVQGIQMAADAIGEFAGRVENGQYASLDELKRDIGPVLRQNR